MRLFEFEAKKIFEEYGISVPKGGLAETPREARNIAERLDCPVVVKAQVLSGGRGKAGGVIFAETPSDAERAAERLLGAALLNSTVRRVLVEERVKPLRELYLGLTIDRLERKYVFIASTRGGIDIEEVARAAPESVFRRHIESEFRSYHARELAREMSFSGSNMLNLSSLMVKLYNLSMDLDVLVAEINPLAELKDGYVALDGRIIIDDNALFRHEEFKRLQEEEWQFRMSEVEYEAMKYNLNYVKLDGNIGVIGNGAGLVMATLDLIHQLGGKPSNFLDLGGGADSERVAKALELLLVDPGVEGILINILGGITRCDEVAKGILEATERVRTEKSIVIRLSGRGEKEAKKLLTEAGFEVLEDMEAAVNEIVGIFRRGF